MPRSYPHKEKTALDALSIFAVYVALLALVIFGNSQLWGVPSCALWPSFACSYFLVGCASYAMFAVCWDNDN